MYYRAVNSVTDDPYKIFESFVQFEREGSSWKFGHFNNILEGTIEELDTALEKVNAQVVRIQERDAIKKAKQGKTGEANGRKRKSQTDLQDNNFTKVSLRKLKRNYFYRNFKLLIYFKPNRFLILEKISELAVS